MKYLSLLFLAALFFAFGCGNSLKTGYQKVQSSDGGYSVVLPAEMREMKGLNASASMQYGNFDSGISFMVIVDDFLEYKKIVDANIGNFQMMECFDTTRAADIYGLKGYEFLIMQLSKAETEDFRLDNSMDDDTVINGLKARVSEYREKIKGDNSAVILCLYKGKNKLYQVYAMSSQKKLAENKQIMLDMVKSLEEN